MAIYKIGDRNLGPSPNGIKNHKGEDLLSALKYLKSIMKAGGFNLGFSLGKVETGYLKTYVVSKSSLNAMREFFSKEDLIYQFDFDTALWVKPGMVLAKFFFRKKKSKS